RWRNGLHRVWHRVPQTNHRRREGNRKGATPNPIDGIGPLRCSPDANSVGTELIDDPTKPTTGCVTRWLGRQRVLTITIRWRNGKIIALGGHASDNVLTSRVVHVDGAIPTVKMIGFCPASSHIFGLVGHTIS